MARRYERVTFKDIREKEHSKALSSSLWAALGLAGFAATPIAAHNPGLLFAAGLLPALAFGSSAAVYGYDYWVNRERNKESKARGGRPVLGAPPRRDAFEEAQAAARARGKSMIDRYMVGFELETGEPLWVSDDDMCSHGCVFAKTGVGKTLLLESLIFQQMLRGRASGCTFIDAKRDSGTLAQVILMATVTGRIEDLIVVDPFDPVHAYNFTLTEQRADVKARKVLRAGLPPTSDQSATKHYDRLAADSIARMVRAMESFGLAWSIHDIAVALSAFQLSYPYLQSMLTNIGAKQALVELGHLASSYRNAKGALDAAKLTENLRGISSELHAISGSEMGEIFCTNYTDLNLTDAMLQGKIIYFMLPRLEEAEGAARMVKVFREDLEISIGEITSSRVHHLEDPHLVIVDEGSSTFGPTWANLFELARKGRFSLFFGAQSAGGLTDASLGLSEAFYERVMANVNLKVMMRIGDNRTAEDMAEWFGKVTTLKTAYGAGMTVQKSSRVFTGPVDVQSRSAGGESQSISLSEDEDYFVSPEELKHEMSAEKGLAWYDLGDGKIVKGRSFWFGADLPDTWEGREFLTQFDRFERDGIGLGSWVDDMILSVEQGNPPPEFRLGQAMAEQVEAERAIEEDQKELPAPDDDGVFKLDLNNSNRIKGSVRAMAQIEVAEKAPEKEPEPLPVEEKKGPFRLMPRSKRK